MQTFKHPHRDVSSYQRWHSNLEVVLSSTLLAWKASHSQRMFQKAPSKRPWDKPFGLPNRIWIIIEKTRYLCFSSGMSLYAIYNQQLKFSSDWCTPETLPGYILRWLSALAHKKPWWDPKWWGPKSFSSSLMRQNHQGTNIPTPKSTTCKNSPSSRRRGN